MDSSGKTRPIRVERLSPMAPSRRASGGVFQCRAIVPNGSTRRASGGVLRLFGRLPYRPRWLQAPIDWGQSIYQNDAQATID